MTKEELTKTHPLYDEQIDGWNFHVRSYFGGQRYRDGDYLLQHPFESTTNYERRKEIAYFYNFCAPVVDIFVSLLYKRSPERNYGSLTNDNLFQDFLGDADLEYNTYPQFMREAGRYAGIYGRVSVIVDKPSMIAGTKADESNLGIRPYLNLITPDNVINWKHVKLPSGRVVLDSVHIVEEWVNKKPSVIRVWNRLSWELFVINGEIEEATNLSPTLSGTHGLGVVPMVNIYNKNAITRMSGISDLEDIADINKNIYYLCSDAQEIIENTAFPMLAEPYSKSSPDGENKEVGPRNILQFDPTEPNAKPYWLEAPHSSLDKILDFINNHAKQIFKTANLAGIKNAVESKQPWSGTALDIDNQQRDAVLAEKADNAEQSENKILGLWALWQGKEFDGEINYPDDFSIKDQSQNTQAIFEILRDLDDISPLFAEELEKKLASNTLKSDIPDDRLKAVNDDIENKPTTNQEDLNEEV